MAYRQQILAKQIQAHAGKLQLVPRVRGIFPGSVRAAQREHFRVQRVREALHLRVAQAAFYFDPVGLWERRQSFHHAAGEFAVVGQENHAACGVVQTADRKNAVGDSDQIIAKRAAAFRVGERGDDFGRLVHQKIDVLFGGLCDAASGFDAIVLGVGFGAEFSDDDAVDADLAAAD
jgi:hypothetical protein